MKCLAQLFTAGVLFLGGLAAAMNTTTSPLSSITSFPSLAQANKTLEARFKTVSNSRMYHTPWASYTPVAPLKCRNGEYRCSPDWRSMQQCRDGTVGWEKMWDCYPRQCFHAKGGWHRKKKCVPLTKPCGGNPGNPYCVMVNTLGAGDHAGKPWKPEDENY